MRTQDRAEQLIRTLQNKTPMLYIGGLGVESEGNATIQVTNPYDGTMLGRCPAANRRDVDRAVKAGLRAFEDGWADMPPAERANILWRAADVIESSAHDLAILESLQTGKTFREALTTDVSSSVAALRYYAGFVSKRAGQVYDLGGGFIGISQQEPHPIVAAIMHWSFPLASAVWRAAAALAGGSSVLLKPSELTPLSVFRFAELMQKAGLPPGVLNVVTGFGHITGEAIAEHPDIPALSFSGSIENARRVLVASAKTNLKAVHPILGGKGANIIFEDANVKRAASTAWKAIFTARGEISTAGSRLLVHQDLYDEICAVVTHRAREIVLGDPLDDHTEMGPVISEEQMKRVLAYVEIGRKEGARLVAGGSRDVDGHRSSGFFVKPTVFMDVEPSMRLAKEEISGPVLTILPFKNEDEAVEIANSTDYGLANAIWTRDLARAHRVSRRLRCGIVWVNHYDHVDPALPFGGTKLSGFGRDLGAEGMNQFSHSKAIYIPSY